MQKIDRTVVQAVLAIVIVVGAFLLVGFGQQGHVPTEALWSLVGLVVGYYFGFAVHKPDAGDES